MAAAKKDAKPKDEDEKTAAPEVSEEAKKKKKKRLMIIGLIVVVLGISIGATVLAIKLLSAKSTPSEEDIATSESAEGSEEDDSEEDAKPTLPAIYYALKPNFTVNFDVNGRQRFLQAELTLMYRDPEILHFLELHMPDVRNGLVMLLSSQLFDDLQTLEGKEKLRAAALKTVQDILTKEQLRTAAADKEKTKTPKNIPNIEQVLFTHFVMQ